MAAKLRVYTVRPANGAPRLIRAANASQARNYAARDTFSVAVADQDDLLTLHPATPVEDARDEPESDTPQLKVA